MPKKSDENSAGIDMENPVCEPAEDGGAKEPVKKEKEPKPKKNSKAEKNGRADELAAELAEKTEQLLRLAAEYDNFRKRTAKEKEELYSLSKVTVVAELLPVIDNFERAVGGADAGLEEYKKGVEMIYSQFTSVLGKLGIERFGEAGEPFDPTLHSAVMHIEDESLGENVIADVFAPGYRLADRIVRPAAVRVAN